MNWFKIWCAISKGTSEVSNTTKYVFYWISFLWVIYNIFLNCDVTQNEIKHQKPLSIASVWAAIRAHIKLRVANSLSLGYAIPLYRQLIYVRGCAPMPHIDITYVDKPTWTVVFVWFRISIDYFPLYNNELHEAKIAESFFVNPNVFLVKARKGSLENI